MGGKGVSFSWLLFILQSYNSTCGKDWVTDTGVQRFHWSETAVANQKNLSANDVSLGDSLNRGGQGYSRDRRNGEEALRTREGKGWQETAPERGKSRKLYGDR